MLKRLFDLTAVLMTAPLWLPILLVVAVLVRAQLGSPVLFRQKRPGRGGRVFAMMKFRTMTDERDVMGRLRPDAERLTSFGRWLRACSLDELPELFNVLRGDMSLVGPRPLLLEYLPRYSPRQSRRHEVPPGLTGLAQIKGRNSISWEEKFEWDVTYVLTRSLWLDLRILFATINKVIRRDGINAQNDVTMPEFKPLATTDPSISIHQS